MEKALLDAGRPLSAGVIAETINKRDLYRKRDGLPLGTNQVSARARGYPHLFAHAAGAISLANAAAG